MLSKKNNAKKREIFLNNTKKLLAFAVLIGSSFIGIKKTFVKSSDKRKDVLKKSTCKDTFERSF